ncbi:MAG TPA: FHA domain-containing protein [Burkholderiaceae bacterium]
MPKVIVSLDGVVVREVPLQKSRTTVGRRPYNDIVIDNLAVSGEHAVFLVEGDGIFVEDLGSTNGTHVNGKAIHKELLHSHDTVEIGKFRIRLVDAAPEAVRASVVDVAPALAHIRVLAGSAVGREMVLTKVVTTIGKTGEGSATITHSGDGYLIAHASGPRRFRVNGTLLGAEAVLLQPGDLLELGPHRMQFVQ